MKKFFLLLAVIFLLSCSEEDKTVKIRDQIKAYKSEIAELQKKVHELEDDLDKKLSDSNDQRVLVKADTIQNEIFHHYFEARGNVESINEAFISPEVNGQIKKVYVSEGDNVKEGEMLAKLNTKILENSVKEVKKSLELATTIYNKQKQLWDKNIGSELQYLEAKNNKESLETKLETLEAQLSLSYIKSPIDGIVDEIFQKEGELAVPGVQLMQIVNLKDLFINADIAEKHLPSIKKGDMVKVSFPSYPDIEMETPVYKTGNVINPQNRTFNIQLKLKNKDNKLKPNIMSIIKINDYSNNDALVIPSIIMKRDMNGTYVYKLVKDDENKLIAKKVYITPGISFETETEVLDGLQKGDIVITEGYNIVSDGTEINVK